MENSEFEKFLNAAMTRMRGERREKIEKKNASQTPELGLTPKEKEEEQIYDAKNPEHQQIVANKFNELYATLNNLPPTLKQLKAQNYGK